MLSFVWLPVFALLFALYFVQRIFFAVWNWRIFSEQPMTDLLQAFFFGLRFDWSVIAMLAVIPLLLTFALEKWRDRAWTLKVVLLMIGIFQFPLMIANISDTEFIHHTGRRYTVESLFTVRELPGKTLSFALYYWPVALVIVLILGFGIAALWQLRKMPIPQMTKGQKTVLVVGLLIFTFVGARGGIQKKPISFAHAQVFTQPMMNNLVLNSSFTFVQTITRKSLEREHFFDSSEEMLSHLNGHLQGNNWLDQGYRPKTPQNVVLIILESFSFEHMGLPHHGDGYTPFLDSLAKRSAFFPNAFANGRRSIEGIGAVMGGVPALMAEPFISSQYMTNQFLGLGTVLTKAGYHSAFFHGAHNGSMYFDQFMKSAGVNDYYGLNEFPDPSLSDGTWGIWDEPMFLWSLDKMNEFPRPFFAAIFSLTSHHPFVVPPQYEGKFPEGKSEIHKAIGYTDFALSEFFAKAEKMPWYKDTLFIVTADHTYKPFRPEYDNTLSQYRVPLILFHPSIPLSEYKTEEPVSHVDIMPTILDFVGARTPQTNYLGTSVFQQGPRSVINYIDGRYYLIMKDYYMEYVKAGQTWKMYALSDPAETTPLTMPLERFQDLQNRLKASIQYFSEGLWDNKLYYPVK